MDNKAERQTQIQYRETNFANLEDHPLRMRDGIYIAVVSGTATLNTGAETYHLVPQMELSFISGSLGQCSDRSDDFKVRLFTYTPELLAKTTLQIDHIYFEYNETHPTYIHTPDPRSQRTWNEIMLWMDMAKMLFGNDNYPKFREQQEENFLQSFWMWVFDTIQERIDTKNNFTGTQLIAHRFISMVKNSAATHHRVDYYAQQLNISQRYLNRIVWRHTRGRTPKQVIDAQLVAEIKELLIDSTLSATQIAERLNFPDQSYLSRFFRRHTGLSPAQYRSSRSLHWKY